MATLSTIEVPQAAAAAAPAKSGLAGRVTAIDAYRGLVMFLMMAEVLEFAAISAAHPGSAFWHLLGHHQSHVEWVGCSLHDLIQPSFSFLVGVALPFSIASRLARGQSRVRMTVHAFWRALLLILLGVFLRSLNRHQTYWTFEDTLTQIGLGYGALFLLGLRPVREQWLALGIILVGYWVAFALYPLPGATFDYDKVGVANRLPWVMPGFAGHWSKNSNLARAFDRWFLNLFPREKPFTFNGGGYATLSFIPTLGTMILGLIAGSVLRRDIQPWSKVKWLVVAGGLGLGIGLMLGWLGLCPVVKRIWTPSWTIFSGGWCFLLLAGFYASMEIGGAKKWAFPLTVIGMNSIAAYCMAHLFEGFISRNLATNLGANTFTLLGESYEPLMKGGAILLVLWLLLFWMYRRKLFLRI